jgi:hypothetical protein
MRMRILWALPALALAAGCHHTDCMSAETAYQAPQAAPMAAYGTPGVVQLQKSEHLMPVLEDHLTLGWGFLPIPFPKLRTIRSTRMVPVGAPPQYAQAASATTCTTTCQTTGGQVYAPQVPVYSTQVYAPQVPAMVQVPMALAPQPCGPAPPAQAPCAPGATYAPNGTPRGAAAMPAGPSRMEPAAPEKGAAPPKKD